MSNDLLVTQLASVIDQQAELGTVIDLPESAPFDVEQRQWLNGLLTGISTIAAAAKAGPEEEAPGTPLTILYGSQSGNCEVLSKDMKKFAATQGFEATIIELDNTTPADVAGMDHVVIICSTFGEGEPPDNAKNFYTALMANDAAALPASVNFSVCGLGDSSYADFNKCAEDIFARMVELGATPCHDLVSCDVAFEDDYAHWKEAVFNADAFVNAAGAASNDALVATDDQEPKFTKNNPFIGNLIEVNNLSGAQSAKRVKQI